MKLKLPFKCDVQLCCFHSGWLKLHFLRLWADSPAVCLSLCPWNLDISGLQSAAPGPLEADWRCFTSQTVWLPHVSMLMLTHAGGGGPRLGTNNNNNKRWRFHNQRCCFFCCDFNINNMSTSSMWPSLVHASAVTGEKVRARITRLLSAPQSIDFLILQELFGFLFKSRVFDPTHLSLRLNGEQQLFGIKMCVRRDKTPRLQLCPAFRSANDLLQHR